MAQTAPLPKATPEPVATVRAPELSVVIPTYRERANVALLASKLDAALAGHSWEAIFVDDDSPDGTADEVRRLAAADPRLRCLKRVNRRGLAGACIEGMLSSSAEFVAVMDADLQHDESLLPRMLAILKSGAADLVVGSRYAAGGNADAFSGSRGTISWLATALAKALTKVQLSDPMSGFFMIRRSRFEPLAPSLFSQGFKILLDIVITAKGHLRIVEEAYVFAAREHGESKLDAGVGLDFLGLLLAKLSGGVVTPRFLSFALVGFIGLGVHLAVMKVALSWADWNFSSAYVAAALVAMTGNFLLNNVLTYRDKRLTGFAMLKGLFGFYAVSAVGLVAGVGTASWLYAQSPIWWLAGAAGALMAAVWNYSMSTLLVWRVK